MFRKACLFLLSTFVFFCESSFVENLTPCKLDDFKCQAENLQTVLKEGKTGLKEYNIKPFDPIDLPEITVSVLDIVDLTLRDGKVKGIGNCQVEKFVTKIEDRHVAIDLTCDVTVKGKYTVVTSKSFVKSLTGGQSIHGEGNGKVKIEKLRLHLDFYFVVQKKNGEVFVSIKRDKTKYKHEFTGKVTFSADKLYIGNEESSQTLVGLLNQNTQTIFDQKIDRNFVEKAIPIITEFAGTFYDNIPIRYFISDDLSGYVA